MPAIQYMLLLVAIVTVAIDAKRIIRAQEGAATTGNFMVVLEKDTSSERFDEIMRKIKIETDDQRISKINADFAKVITAKLSENALEKIKDEAGVTHIEEETFVSAATSIMHTEMWHLDRIDQHSPPLDGNMFSLHKTGAGIDIYILDTGIDYSHDEFGGRAKLGRDIIDSTTGSSQQGQDCHGHGTHAAALAGGSTYGVARDATLYSVRVLGCDGTGKTSDVLQGLMYAALMIRDTSPRRGIISMSLSGSYSTMVTQHINAFVNSLGIPIIVAAGNKNTDACNTVPGGAVSAITVGATAINDSAAYRSNYGACVDIYAPGVDITSADINDCGTPPCTIVYSGTSRACSLVSGMAAVILEGDNTLTPAELTQVLIESSIKDMISELGPDSPNRLLCGMEFAYKMHKNCTIVL